jgi:hypothetical protein
LSPNFGVHYKRVFDVSSHSNFGLQTPKRMEHFGRTSSWGNMHLSPQGISRPKNWVNSLLIILKYKIHIFIFKISFKDSKFRESRDCSRSFHDHKKG